MMKKYVQNTIKTLAVLWFVYMIIHIVFVGKFFLLNFPASTPTFFFVIVPVILLVYFLIQKKKKVIFIGIVSVSLIMGITQFDINIATKSNNNINKDNYMPVKVFCWNTNLWDQLKDGNAFYDYLKNQKADVYLLQEYLHCVTDRNDKSQKPFKICNIIPGFPPNYLTIDETERIKKEFPGYYFSTDGQFVIISKYPIIRSHADYSEQYAVSDVEINGETMRFFNVHMLLHIEPGNPFVPYFYNAISRRYKAREIGFKNLYEDIKKTNTDYFIEGDFNSSKSMGVMNGLLKNHIDTVKYSKYILPLTFEMDGLKLWRFDYAFVPKNDNILISSHKYLPHKGLSDHNPLSINMYLKR